MELLTRKELAEELKVTERTIDIWRASKGLPFIKMGALVRFERERVLEWLRNAKVSG